MTQYAGEAEKGTDQADVSLHGKYNVDNVDFSVIERIAEELSDELEAETTVGF